MRVLIVFTQPWHRGGAETHLETLVGGLLRQGVKVVLAGLDDEIIRYFNHIPVYKLPFRSRNPLTHFQNQRKLKKIIEEHSIQLIHAHHRTASVYAFFMKLSMAVPYVVTFHDKWRPLHRAYKVFFPPNCIVISNGIKQHFIKVLKVNPKTLHEIANGVCIDNFSSKPDSKKPDGIGDNTILLVSRLNHHKTDVPLLLCKVMSGLNRIIPDIKLLLVGDGPEAGTVEAAVQRANAACGRNAVSFLGQRNDIAWLLSCSSIAVGVGRFALEAMAAGKPVIAIADGSDYPGIITQESWLSASRTSWTRGEKKITKENLSEDIKRLLFDKTLQRNLGEFGRQLIVEEFSAEKMTASVIAVYKKAI
ncbi:MAG: glycosyl transferase group 1 [Firmicutes bacterium]|nr:glycosyl transferase group 1 [Bacillota bacterium]